MSNSFVFLYKTLVKIPLIMYNYNSGKLDNIIEVDYEKTNKK